MTCSKGGICLRNHTTWTLFSLKEHQYVLVPWLPTVPIMPMALQRWMWTITCMSSAPSHYLFYSFRHKYPSHCRLSTRLELHSNCFLSGLFQSENPLSTDEWLWAQSAACRKLIRRLMQHLVVPLRLYSEEGETWVWSKHLPSRADCECASNE